MLTAVMCLSVGTPCSCVLQYLPAEGWAVSDFLQRQLDETGEFWNVPGALQADAESSKSSVGFLLLPSMCRLNTTPEHNTADLSPFSGTVCSAQCISWVDMLLKCFCTQLSHLLCALKQILCPCDVLDGMQRVAVTGSLSCKLMRQLTTQMTDGPNCLEQQGLLPELHTSDEEPTDTTEILEFAESALHEQHLPATSLVLPTGQAAASVPGHSMFDAPGAVWQQGSLQGSQLLQTRTASGCMYELPAGMTAAQQGGRIAPSVHRPCDEAATQHQMHMMVAGSFAQQAQQHPGHQQQQHAAFFNPAG